MDIPVSHLKNPRISHWCRAGPRSWMVVTRRLTRRQPYDQGLGKPFVFLNKAGYEILISRAGTLGGGVGWVVIKYVNPAQFHVVFGCLFMYIPFETGRNSFWIFLEWFRSVKKYKQCQGISQFDVLFFVWLVLNACSHGPTKELLSMMTLWVYHDGKPWVLGRNHFGELLIPQASQNSKAHRTFVCHEKPSCSMRVMLDWNRRITRLPKSDCDRDVAVWLSKLGALNAGCFLASSCCQLRIFGILWGCTLHATTIDDLHGTEKLMVWRCVSLSSQVPAVSFQGCQFFMRKKKGANLELRWAVKISTWKSSTLLRRISPQRLHLRHRLLLQRSFRCFFCCCEKSDTIHVWYIYL